MKFSFTITLFWIVSCTFISAEHRTKDTPDKTASSSDNNFVITHKPIPNTLVIQELKTNSQLKTIPIIDIKGNSSDISGIHDATARNSFIITLKNSPEVWEINYQNPAPIGFGTWVHDYRKESSEAKHTLFPIRRIKLKAPFDDFFFDDKYVNIISVSCNGNIQIIDLDLGKIVATYNLSEKNSDIKNIYGIKSLNHHFF